MDGELDGFEKLEGEAKVLFYAEINLETGEFIEESEQSSKLDYKSIIVPSAIRIVKDGIEKRKVNGQKHKNYYCYSVVSQDHANKVCIEKYQEYLRKNALKI